MTNLLIGVSGSVGVLSLPTYLGVLYQSFPKIKLILTHSAAQFIPKSTLSLIVPDIYSSEFPISSDNPSHIELARWADLFIILPASANLISHAAMGLANTLLTTTILAYDKEIIFFPNMNKQLWNNRILKRNAYMLKRCGHRIINPIEKLAFETASRKMELQTVLPSPQEVLSLVHSNIKVKQNGTH